MSWFSEAETGDGPSDEARQVTRKAFALARERGQCAYQGALPPARG